MVHDYEATFIQEGTKSYLDALRAIRKYEELIREETKRAFTSKRDLFEAAIDIPIEPNKIGTWSNSDLDEEWAAIGINFNISNYGTFYISVSLDGDGNFSADATIDTWNVKRRNHILEFARKKCSTEFTNPWGNEVNISESVTNINRDTLFTALQNVLESWIGFWKEVGKPEEFFKGL